MSAIVQQTVTHWTEKMIDVVQAQAAHSSGGDPRLADALVGFALRVWPSLLTAGGEQAVAERQAVRQVEAALKPIYPPIAGGHFYIEEMGTPASGNRILQKENREKPGGLWYVADVHPVNGKNYAQRIADFLNRERG
mgnify:CR=1 FL=1